MVTQKLISFKCNADQLARLDRICSLTGIKCNKLLNKCVSFAVSVMEMQLEVALKRNKLPKSIYFLSEI